MTNIRGAILCCGAVLLIAGCASPDNNTGSGDGSHSAKPASAETPAMTKSQAPSLPPGLSPADFETALADCSRRSGKTPAALRIVTARHVTWNDASLGCPEPGLGYAQVLINGYWLVISDGEREYDYRSGGKGRLAFCKNPTRGPLPAGPNHDDGT